MNQRLKRSIWLSVALSSALIPACGDEQAPSSWRCSAETNGWTRCTDEGKVEACHGTKSPHFHDHVDCESQGLMCASTSEQQAQCVAAFSCTPAQERCDGAQVYQCVDDKLIVERCGDQQVCELDGGRARCVQAPTLECGPHGQPRAGSCQCDAGYRFDEVAKTCAQEDTQEPDCAGLGTWNGSSCDCQQGYEPDPDQPMSCVPVDAQVSTFAFTPSTAGALYTIDEGLKPVWLYRAKASTSAQLTIENHVGYGGPAMPGTFEIAAKDSSYNTCGFCVVLETQCHSHGDELHCDRAYMPISGSYTLKTLGTSAQERFEGTLNDVVFALVQIDPATAKTTPVPGATPVKLSGPFTWSEQLQVRQPPEPECSGHGHLHGDTCHCDPGYKLDPQDKARCIPQ